MCAVRGGESIITIDIAKRGEEASHLWIIYRFHGGEAGVLHEDDSICWGLVDHFAAWALNKCDSLA